MVVKMAKNKTQAAKNAAKEIEQQMLNGVKSAVSSPQCITVTGKPSTGQAGQHYKYQDYTKTWRNYCPFCHKTGTLTDNPKGVYEHEITCDKSKGGCDADFDVTTGADKSGAYRAYLQDANGNSNSKNKVDTTIGDSLGASTSSTTTSSSATGSYTGYSPLLSGEQSFQQLVAEITNGINILVLCKRNIIKVTDFETLYAEAQVLRANKKYVDEDIHLWQLEDGTYELDVNEYGFYNTVNVVYSGGVITETYEDLVRVYGVMAKTYYDKTLTKSQAQAKAKAYLAAHIQEFGMEIKCSILHNPAIEIGDIVTLENPMTLRDAVKKVNKGLPEYLFVKDMSISWDDGGPIRNDLVLSYSPEAPERDADTSTSANTVASDSTSSGTGGTDQTGYGGETSTSSANTETSSDSSKDAWHQNVWDQLYEIVKTYIDVTNRTEYTNRLYKTKTDWTAIAKVVQGHKIKNGASRNFVIGQIRDLKRGAITKMKTEVMFKSKSAGKFQSQKEGAQQRSKSAYSKTASNYGAHAPNKNSYFMQKYNK